MTTKKTPAKAKTPKSAVKKTTAGAKSQKPAAKKATTGAKASKPAAKKTPAKAAAKAKAITAPKTRFIKTALLPTPGAVPVAMVPAPSANMLPLLDKAFDEIAAAVEELQDGLPIDQPLTGVERMRLIGVRARNYGFLAKAWEVINARPDFAPPKFSLEDMATLANNLNRARDLSTLAEQFQRIIDDYLLTVGTLAYRDGLTLYRNLQAMARARVPGAAELFDQLRQFFTLHRRGRGADAEPSMHEIEREINSVLHGRSDGEILIKHESPHMVGGEHEVVENVSKRGKRKAEIKVKE